MLTPQNMWVRDFTRTSFPFIDINNTISTKDHSLFLDNEIKNNKNRLQWIDTEKINHPKILIVSDGYDFSNKHKYLANLPKDVTIIAVNGALSKWDLSNKSINYYVANNPYAECMRHFPRKTKAFPKMIVSPRTNHEFVMSYKGMKYRYYPVNESTYCSLGIKEASWQIDDYRNPICAAIGLAFRFGVEKLMTFCCDDSFSDERPGANKLENGLWMYPQHEVAHGLIDGNLYWLTKQVYTEIRARDCSSGLNYKNASYINIDDVVSFFGENI